MSQKQRAKKQPARSQYRVFYIVLGVVALAGIGALGWSVTSSKASKAAMKPLDMSALANDTKALYEKAVPVKAGPDSARVRIVVLSDYTCPFCGRFAAEVQPRLVQDFVNQGKVQLIYYDFPLGGEGEHQYSYLAARAARCAGEQGKFWQFHDVIFGQQSSWAFQGKPPVDTFEQDAARLGLDAQKYNACLESDRYLDVVTANHMLGETLGVNHTPTVIMDQQEIENPLDYADFKARIETALGAGK